MTKRILIGFGEIMGRLCPQGVNRFVQAMPGSIEASFAGAEANVLVSNAMLGGLSRYVTALPKHDIAECCLRSLKRFNVDVSYVLRSDQGRLGLYFVERGANQRPSVVVYDREGSSVSLTNPDAYPWDDILDGAGWLHLSGITPALSCLAAAATIVAAMKARAAGCTVSCDLNFRKNLWRWDSSYSPKELAGKTMRRVLPHVDVVIANEADASDVLGIHAGAEDVEAGVLNTDKYPDVAREIINQFPGVSQVAITLRESISASHNNWGAMLYDKQTDQAHFAPVDNGAYKPYEIRNIVDRVGGGDSFAGGLIFALMDEDLKTPESAIRFAVASSCLAHSIEGDFNLSSRKEVEALMHGSGSGRVRR